MARDKLAVAASLSPATVSEGGSALSFSLDPFLDFDFDGCCPIGGVPGGCGELGLPLPSLLVKTESRVGAMQGRRKRGQWEGMCVAVVDNGGGEEQDEIEQ